MAVDMLSLGKGSSEVVGPHPMPPARRGLEVAPLLDAEGLPSEDGVEEGGGGGGGVRPRRRRAPDVCRSPG